LLEERGAVHDASVFIDIDSGFGERIVPYLHIAWSDRVEQRLVFCAQQPRNLYSVCTG
jgi:hypothetical protein